MLSLLAASAAWAQVINRDVVEAFLQEGEVTKAQKNLESYLGNPDLTYQDSIYILKNLGVLYASSPKRKDLGDRYFHRLLELDPFASIHDTYASNSILARFRNIRKAFQQTKGGKALVPAVIVFDFTGPAISAADGAAMAQQFIAEMQRLDVFHTLDRSNVVETLAKRKMAVGSLRGSGLPPGHRPPAHRRQAGFGGGQQGGYGIHLHPHLFRRGNRPAHHHPYARSTPRAWPR